MDFEIIGEITNLETIAVGREIRDLSRLRKVYGPGRWRKLKGMARIRFGQWQTCVWPSYTGIRRTVSERKNQAQAIP